MLKHKLCDERLTTVVKRSTYRMSHSKAHAVRDQRLLKLRLSKTKRVSYPQLRREHASCSPATEACRPKKHPTPRGPPLSSGTALDRDIASPDGTAHTPRLTPSCSGGTAEGRPVILPPGDHKEKAGIPGSSFYHFFAQQEGARMVLVKASTMRVNVGILHVPRARIAAT